MAENDQTTEYDDVVKLLDQMNADLENLEQDMSKPADELIKELEDLGKELQKNFKELVKATKKDMKQDMLAFYHENKKLVDSDLKDLNKNIKIVLDNAKDELNKAMRSSKDPDERAFLQGILLGVVEFSRAYNHKYRTLKIKLALENAGYSIKEAFKKKD